MTRRIPLLFSFFAMTFIAISQLNISLHAQTAVPQYSPLFNVNFSQLTPVSSPLYTVVDPFATANLSDPLKPSRPFWYTADKDGLTVLTLDGNKVVEYIPWNFIPAGITTPGIPVVQPDGSFVNVLPPLGGYQVVGMTVSYPTDEALASNSETPPTYVYVVVANSGYEWQSEAAANLPAGRDPNLRDKLVPSTNPATESAMLIQIDVTDPTLPLNDPLAPIAPLAGAILGHGAGQPAYDPATGSVYVPNMPSLSLPTTPDVPVDLTSFVSVVAAIAAPELAAAGEAGGAEAPPIIVGLESPDVLPNSPLAFPLIAEGGEGPFVWEFMNLPSWLTAHADKITGQLDGIIYGTVPATGSWTFQVRVTDNGAEPALTSEWTSITMTANAAAEEQLAGELPFEAGAPNAVAIQGTGSCTLGPTTSPGSIVPNWIDAIQIPGGVNLAMPSEQSIGCVIAGTAPISGEYYEFTMPNFKFAYPWDREPVLLSGNVAGAYVFDPLPAGVTISGLAWHEIDKIHDASTEADILNAEFFGVEPLTGQVYRILPPQGALEISGAIAPPEISVDIDAVSAYTDLLTPLTTSRPDIAAALAANPNRRVRFGDLVVEASRDPNVYVTAREILDPTGADPTVIPIGGPVGSTIDTGALVKVSSTRDAVDPTLLTLSAINTIDLPGLQAYSLGLDSDLAPAVRGTDTVGQIDHGVLWVTGPSSGNTAVVDTTQGIYSQVLAVPSATSLGGVSINFGTRAAYVVGIPTQSVTVFGTGGGTVEQRAPVIWGASPGVGIEATLAIGTQSSIRVMATGSPTPSLSYSGTLPSGITFLDNGDGTANLVGIAPAGTENTYTGTITAMNGVSPNDTETFSLTVASPPTITSLNTATFTVGAAGSFTATTSSASATLSYAGTLPSGLTITDNEDGTATLAGTPVAGTAGTYVGTITATTGAPPDAAQAFTLIINAEVGAGATMISPASGSTLESGLPATFTWTSGGADVTTTYLWVGTAPGSVNLVNFGGGSATSFTISDLPVGPIYVRLWSLINSVLQYQDYAYTVAAPQLAAIISPANGSTLSAGVPVTFTWTPGGASVTTTYLWVSTAVGGNELVNFGGGAATSFTQDNLPAGPIHVRLWSLVSGVLKYQDYSYTVATPTLAAMISPAGGSTVPSGVPVTFSWSPGGAYVTTTYLWVGTALGTNNLVNFGGGSTTSFTVGSLSAGPIYVRLWSKIGEQLYYQDYTYAAEVPVPAAMISPENGSAVGNPVTFTWTPGTNATTTYLWVGTALGTNNLVNFGGGSATSFAVNLPAGLVYVRLWSLIGGQLQYQEYTYTVQ